ncbi:(2Fe-2S)-binding protein [bacterium AH-315-J21]|nr:(2Fe-2S)-binding protein [bacterium AH-315-J21]
MLITHCVCHEVSFAKIKKLSESMETSEIGALQKEIPFGGNCGMCLPYIKRMLKTGETVFSELVTDDV